ncbi:MAG: phosphohistidine phosphatase SixA [Oscillatoriales cyanobacterium]|jgi:phosphohistidine phosphatase|nr:MAG: phosphohistidine phosphatase SixA [Oscillatoriales cyanobacterium]
MSQLYFIRHGIAADREHFEHDFDRPLTDHGIAKTSQIAQRLAALGLCFDRILTSPLVRAQQTAELLRVAGLCGVIEELSALAPGGEVEALAAWWSEFTRGEASPTIAIVGHQPDLGLWAEWLLWGQPLEKLIVKKAGIIGLEVPAKGLACGTCELFWLTPPRFLI